MNYVNFKSKNMMKNFKKALKASHHIKQGEKVYFTMAPNTPFFQRNETVHKHIDAIISEMMQNQIIQNNFSKKELKEDIILILGYLDRNNALNMSKKDYGILYNQLITKLENKINNIIETEFEDFECYFHIENLKLDNKLKIGDVILFPVKSREEFEALNEKLHFDFFMENEVYAKTRVYGSKNYAHTKSQTKIKIVLNMLKLFLYDYECNFNLEGDVIYPKNRFYVLINLDNDITAGFSPSSSNFGCNFNKDAAYDDFQLYILSTLFINEPKSEIENRLITAIYWFGEALSVQFKHSSKIENKHENKLDNIEFFDGYNKLVYLIISLESLFVYNEKSKSKAISKKVPALIANPGYEQEIEEFLRKIYDYRSKIVHSGIMYLSKDDINRLINCTRFAIFEVLYINHFYNDKINKIKIYNNNSNI